MSAVVCPLALPSSGGKGDKALQEHSFSLGCMDIEERNRTIETLLPLVTYIARRIHGSLPANVAFADIYQMGAVGLIDAVAKYDERKKVHFQSYVRFRIRGAILDGLRALDWSSRQLRQKAREVEWAENGLRSLLGHNPTDSEIAQEMSMSLTELQGLASELRGLNLTSLESNISTSKDGKKRELSWRLAAREDDPFHAFAKNERIAQLTHALHQLPEKQQEVLTLYYFEELTMKEIAQSFRVAESRISQIHTIAVLQLRSLLPERKLRIRVKGA